jgi:S-layer protein (TIGR01567 family)
MSILILASISIKLAIMFPVIGQASDSQDIGSYQDSVIISGQVATGDFTWNPQNFAGFYYDLDSDVGTEELTTTLNDSQLSGSEPFGLTYRTTAQEKPFSFQGWGSYSVIGYLGRECLAGYQESMDADKNLFFGKSKDANSLAKGQLEEVLLDDDAETVITTNNPLILKNGYELELKAFNETDGRIYVELAKDGQVVNSKLFQLEDDASVSDATYYYKTDVEAQKGLVVIAVHFKNAFRASDQDLATIDGIFQISDSPILVAKGTSFGKMKISAITSDQIFMDNQDSPIILTENKDVLLAWPSLYLRTADQSVVDEVSPLRYCLYREIDSPGKYDIRGSVSTWDYTWTPQNFAGFHYDIDHDVGTETLTATLSDDKLSGDGYPYGLVYETSAQQMPFKFQDWGSYYVIGFLGEKCFAGYIEGSDSEEGYLFDKSTDRNTLEKSQLLKVLVDDDTEKTITCNSSLKLDEGYELALKSVDVDGNKAYLELSKNGIVVDYKALQPSKDAATMADKTYYYKNPLVGDQKGLVTIAVHFRNAFRGAGQSIATIDGIWQISDSPIEVKPDTQYDKMTIATVDAASGVISMGNKDYSITLSKHKDTLLMGDIYLQTADSDSLRYYVVKHEE